MPSSVLSFRSMCVSSTSLCGKVEITAHNHNFDFAALQLLHRVIAAVMSEFQLVGLAAERDTDELMSKADAEDRLATHQATDVVHCVSARLGIAGTVRQEHAIRLQREHIFCCGLRRHYSDLAAFTAQLAQNVLLDPKIVRNHVKTRGLVFHSDHRNRLVRALAHFPYVPVLSGNHLR